MGWFGSASNEETKSESKSIDTNGAINNNLILRDEDQTYNVYSQELIILIGILVVLRIIEFGYFMYSKFRGALKKKYSNNNGRP